MQPPHLDGHRPQLEYQLLGQVATRRSGRVITIGSQQQRRLLGLLLANRNTVVSVDQIADVLWGDVVPLSPQRAVQSYVSRLRAVVGENALIRQNGGYRLSIVGAFVEVDEFQRCVSAARARPPAEALSQLRQALSLWAGEPFGEFAGEYWTIARTHHLSELRLSAIEDCFGARLALGEHREVATEIEETVREFPERTQLVGHQMVALYRNGSAAGAIRAFQRHRRIIVDDTGLEPAQSLQQLEQAILANQPSALVGVSNPLVHGYELQEMIGRSTASVYRSVQPVTNRPVCIKVIDSAEAESIEFDRNFERQAQRIARLEHSHIVPLYDFWREPGSAFLVYRLLDGGNLLDAIEASPQWTIERTTRMVHEIAAALSTAHRRGIVHGNVTATNVLFDADGAAYLIDFPIGRNTPGQSSGQASGTADGQDTTDAETAQSTDCFDLCLLAWSALTGRAPDSDEKQTLGTVLRELRPDAPFNLSIFFDQALLATDGIGVHSATALAQEWAAATELSTEPTLDSREAKAAWGGDNPYKGLRAFEESDAEDFFGRSDLIADIERLIETNKFVLVIGPSGSGKSSTIAAGVVPRFRSRSWGVEILQPGDHPSQALFAALQLGSMRAEVPSLIVIDQFEELVSVCADSEERAKFSQCLRDVLESVTSIHVVVSVRVDFLELLLRDLDVGGFLGFGTSVVVPPMNAGELELCVRGPAERRGVKVESALITEIVADVSARPGSMPLLQFALADLFEDGDQASLTLSGYNAVGRIGGALSRRAEISFDALPSALQLALPDLLDRLVGVDEARPITSRRASLSSLDREARLLAEELVRARLLVSGHDASTREPLVELAHESLLREWPRVRDWLEQSKDDNVMLRRIEASTHNWEAGGRLDADLIRGARLQASMEWVGAKQRALTEGEWEFLNKSKRAANMEADQKERSLRLVRRLSAGLTLLLAIALVAAGWAVSQRIHARAAGARAETRRLLVTAAQLANKDSPSALLLAVEGHRRSGLPIDSTDALATTLMANPGSRGNATFPFPVHRVLFNRRGSHVIGVGERGVVSIDSRTHHVAAQRTLSPAIGSEPMIALGPGSTLIVGDAQGQVRFLDDVTLADASPALNVTTPVRGFATTKSGGLLAVAGDFGTVNLWDTASRTLRGGITIPGGSMNLHFTDDDQQLLISAELEAGVQSTVGVWSVSTMTEVAHLVIPGTVKDVLGDGNLTLVNMVLPIGGTELRVQDMSVQPDQWQAVHTSRSRIAVADGVNAKRAFGDADGIWVLDSGALRARQISRSTVQALALSPDDASYAALTSSTSAVFGSLDGTSALAIPLPNPPSVACDLEVSADSQYAACQSPGRVWKLNDEDQPIVFDDPARNVFLLKGDRALLVGPEGNWEVRDLATSATLEQGGSNNLVVTAEATGRRTATSADGEWFFSADNSHLWQVEIRSNKTKTLLAPDLATSAESTIKRVWVTTDSKTVNASLESGDVLSWKIGPIQNSMPPSVTFAGRSAQRRLLAVAHDGHSILTDASDGSPKFELTRTSSSPSAEYGEGQSLPRLTEPVVEADFASGGTWFATIDSSGTMQLWDTATARPIGLPYTGEPGMQLKFLPSGRRQVLTSEPGKVLLWNLDERSWIGLACRFAGRNLTAAEWKDLGPRESSYAPTCSEWPSAKP